MDLAYTDHVRIKMRRRNIDQAMIDLVVSNPAWAPPTTRGTRYDALVGDRRLCVVIDEGRSPPHVVTAWWFGQHDD